ncbi:hypothetical protein [Frigoriglobus tundricola]|uniref:hypothetical protein n=1 Tax=Frigoriglobus tundricola TaxID=2774151 RepID=UPI0018731155|nr:hypothetical protein [Frigoriglobus tundricola]
MTRFCPPLDRRVVFVFAFPPCTHLAVSGARWFKDKGLNALADALHIVASCNRICEAGNAPFLIENPVSTLSTYWRKPDYSFDPCDYAGYLDDPAPEAYTKRTCLWVGGGFRLPDPRRVAPTLGSKMHLIPPSDDRANLRSAAPRGFSRAVFEANFPHLDALRRISPTEALPTACGE